MSEYSISFAFYTISVLLQATPYQKVIFCFAGNVQKVYIRQKFLLNSWVSGNVQAQF